MVNIGFATGAEQPINRDADWPAATFDEGDLVGYDANGDLVKADADSATAIKAVGVAMAPVDDENNYTTETVQQAVHTEKVTLQNGERVSFAKFGVILENADEDWNFTPGEPVYLAAGGGFTGTAPSTTGDVVQVVGEATDDGNAVWLDVAIDYTTA